MMNRLLAKFVPLSKLSSKSTFSSSSSLVTSSTASGKIRRKSKQVKNLLLLASSDAELSVRYHKLSNKKPKELHFPNTVRSRHFFPSFSCNAFFLAHSSEYAVLWNPTTDKLKFLPESSLHRPPRTRSTSFSYGFGFDHHHYDYKVIRFVKCMCIDDNTENNILVELYSLKSDSWKEVMYPHFPTAPGNHEFLYTAPGNKGVHINGIFYWLSEDGFILSFDFTTEEFPSTPLIPLPQTYLLNCCNNNVLLAEFNGQLAAIVHSRLDLSFDSFFFHIWVWNQESSSWSRVLSKVPCVSCVSYCKVLGFFNNVELYLQSTDGEVVCVDCATGKIKLLGPFVDTWRAYLFPYVESRQPIQV